MAGILIVDDNADSRRLLATLLGHRGHTITEAPDGLAGLEIAGRVRPDLVISDILMPRMDGYDFAHRLRDRHGTDNIRIIFYTSHYDEGAAHDLALACGVSQVLVKPCEAEDLIRAVEHALNSQPAATPRIASGEFDQSHLRLLTDKLSQEAAALKVANTKLAAANYLNASLSSELDPGALLKQMCAGTRALIGARHAVVVALARFDGSATLFASSGFGRVDSVMPPEPMLTGCVPGTAFEQRRSLRAGNPGGDACALGLPAGYPPLHNIVCAPLVSPTHAFGWLMLANKIGATQFSAEDEHLLGTVAAQVGRIYENGTLFAELNAHARSLEARIVERKRAARELARSEARFRQLARAIDEVFWIATEDYSQFSYISPAYVTLWGRPREAAYADASDWLRSVHPDDRARVLDAIRERTGQAERPPLEYRLLRPDGSERWVQAQSYPITGSRGGVRRLAGVARDVTERRRHEETIERLQRMYAVMSGINSMIVRTRDRQVLMQDACRIAVEAGGFLAAWAGLVDPVTHDGSMVASYGLVSQSHDQIAFSARPDAPTRNRPLSAAARLGDPVFLRDMLVHAEVAALVDARVPVERRAMVAVPIKSNGRVIAAFGFVARSDAELDAATMKLLGELSDDIAFGLENIEKEERLEHLAFFDSLTGMPNERLFFDHLGQLLRSGSTQNDMAALMLLDIVDFKQFNDAHGRHEGDAMLRRIGQALSGALPPFCRAARINSDTFAVAVASVQRTEDVRDIFERAAGAVARLVTDADATRLELSAGIALHPADGGDAAELFRNAEAALVRAKTSGQRAMFYSPDINAHVAKRLALQSRLRRAAENHEFLLHYQPKVDGTTHHIVGLEALIRLPDPERGLIPPAEFIPALEETGLIVAVGAHVIEMALADYHTWREQGLEPPRIAVNVSAVQLRQLTFAGDIHHFVHAFGNRPDALELEITESVLMNDLTGHLDMLHDLSAMGIHIAIDDFGTGYSSLGYLATLPVHTVKIDRSFVARMSRDPNSMNIVSTIISLAHSMRLAVCAEGVETEEQCRFLSLLRCDSMQGYYFSKPVPASEISALLRRGGPHRVAAYDPAARAIAP